MKLYGLGHLSYGNLVLCGHISQHGEDILSDLDLFLGYGNLRFSQPSARHRENVKYHDSRGMCPSRGLCDYRNLAY
ncbi:hypothetical protein M6B38_329355 [Iris pallida]|uniref:Uncharacterized protein n=1 Tax=Iris pallida TaxID=29817 RepID=A0AAX6H4S4_IRIPA|nr:hypothetical protein M6B38_329355 [Iris pallida]